jgi:hypothetical protein
VNDTLPPALMVAEELGFVIEAVWAFDLFRVNILKAMNKR